MHPVFFVFGSVNMDLNITVDRFPVPGETVAGTSLSYAFGGKGANQAVALARLRGPSTAAKTGIFLAGKTGNDAAGNDYLHHLREEEIDVRYMGTGKEPTGTAIIEVDGTGANRIVVVSGANGEVDGLWWDRVKTDIGADTVNIFLFQLEIPPETVSYAIETAHAKGGITILDPAPAVKLPDSVWASIEYITPNQSETAFYTGIQPETDAEAERAARYFRDKGVKNVVIKAGSKGSWLFGSEGSWFCPVFPVTVEDTIAAGDSFNAGFAWALGAGASSPDALRFANAVGGLSTTKKGAQDAMPDLSSVEALLQAYPKIVSRRR